jgi:hypothetical protein
MKFRLFHLSCALLIGFCTPALAQNTNLTADIPACRMPAGPILPAKYERLARKYKEFAWVRKAMPDDGDLNGSGWERVDGSSMYSWFEFQRVDLNNDGYCDWYVNSLAPTSSGGDRMTINTLYLGQKSGWIRIGATMPDNKPDELGFGDSDAQQERYLFGEELSVLHDTASKTNYIITAFYDRHEEHMMKPGYRILAWDADKKTLRLLDKWEPGSKAAEVYAFFKAHGARRPAKTGRPDSDTMNSFDPELEEVELEVACDAGSPWRDQKTMSRHVLAHCKDSPKQ